MVAELPGSSSTANDWTVAATSVVIAASEQPIEGWRTLVRSLLRIRRIQSHVSAGLAAPTEGQAQIAQDTRGRGTVDVKGVGKLDALKGPHD